MRQTTLTQSRAPGHLYISLLAVTEVMHEADDSYSVQSTWSPLYLIVSCNRSHA